VARHFNVRGVQGACGFRGRIGVYKLFRKVLHANGEAIRVSRGGATVITDIPVSTGAVIRLTPPLVAQSMPK